MYVVDLCVGPRLNNLLRISVSGFGLCIRLCMYDDFNSFNPMYVGTYVRTKYGYSTN
jgi:hypothetical protein